MLMKRWSRNALLVTLAVAFVCFAGAGCVCTRETVDRELVTDGPVQEAWLRLQEKGRWLSGKALTMDSAGNVYVSGSYTSTVKCSSEGKRVWASPFDGDAEAIALDSAGNVYVSGTAFVGRGNNFDYLTCKFNKEGDLLWTESYDGYAHEGDAVTGMAVDNLGNVYVTGYSRTTTSNNDYVTMKYDTDGKTLWRSRYDGPSPYEGPYDTSYDMARALALDASGNVYVTGASLGVGTGMDYATVKYDADGHELWVERFDGSSGYEDNDSAAAILVDQLGDVYVTGSSGTVKYGKNGNQQWVVATGGTHLAADGSGNIYVIGRGIAKYDTDGNEAWSINAGTRIAAAIVDASGSIYVAGDSCSIAKYDSGGMKAWSVKYKGGRDGYSSGQFNAIAVDASGSVYVTGSVLLGVDSEGLVIPEPYPYSAFAVGKYTSDVSEQAP